MKFCYADESGVGSDVTVVAGIVVDAVRLHRARLDWDDLLEDLRNSVKGDLLELKGRDLYRGNEDWRQVDGGERTQVIDRIIRFMREKKHDLTFGAVHRDNLVSARANFALDGFEERDAWSIAAMHLIFGVQKNYQSEQRNKGNTIFVLTKQRLERS